MNESEEDEVSFWDEENDYDMKMFCEEIEGEMAMIIANTPKDKR